jgi:predicted nucleotidyltransferase
MEKRSIEAIVSALNIAQVRYLIAGGLAVVAHGHVRLTKDVDLIVDFEASNLRRAIAALIGLGYRPIVPVPFDDFADAGKRQEWIREKDAVVFMVFSDEHPTARIDLFINAPLDFDASFQRAVFLDVSPSVRASFVGIEDLISLKKQAGRPLDLDDVEKLVFLQAEKQNAIQDDRENSERG